MARRRSSRFTSGEPLVWLAGGALAIALAMIMGLLGLIGWQGIVTFWPTPLIEVQTVDGSRVLGEITRTESVPAMESMFAGLSGPVRARAESEVADNGGMVRRRLFRTRNFDLTGEDFRWVSDFEVMDESLPEWAVVIERRSWGRLVGTPQQLFIDGKLVARGAPDILSPASPFSAALEAARGQALRSDQLRLEIGRLERAGAVRGGKPVTVPKGAPLANESATRAKELLAELDQIEAKSAEDRVVLVTVEGREKAVPLIEVVRCYAPNRMIAAAKLSLYFSRVGEFLFDNPREANSEGGVFPALWGTLVMTLIMAVAVAPFGVLAALYLREYARPGLLVSVVRIAVNNLAGVPSIVFGVFGLGFFCYILGGTLDELFFADQLPNPTLGKGGLLWASLTLALLTLPVVIVATEEAIAAVPRSMREGSVACGASKWQTIRRIVLPRAMPGILTGLILAMARGAGEVAPLMLVGAVKLAPELPLDAQFPFLHPDRSFMHLGFFIYDLGFQSRNSEAAKPMVFTTTLLLIALIGILNLLAMALRARLRKRYALDKF